MARAIYPIIEAYKLLDDRIVVLRTYVHVVDVNNVKCFQLCQIRRHISNVDYNEMFQSLQDMVTKVKSGELMAPPYVYEMSPSIQNEVMPNFNLDAGQNIEQIIAQYQISANRFGKMNSSQQRNHLNDDKLKLTNHMKKSHYTMPIASLLLVIIGAILASNSQKTWWGGYPPGNRNGRILSFNR